MRLSGDKAIADWLIHVCESYLLRNHCQVTGNTTLGLFFLAYCGQNDNKD